VPSKGNNDGSTRRARDNLCRGGVAPSKARGNAKAPRRSGRATSPAKRDPWRRGGPRARVSGGVSGEAIGLGAISRRGRTCDEACDMISSSRARFVSFSNGPLLVLTERLVTSRRRDIAFSFRGIIAHSLALQSR
jgi:hypothetical protein